MSNVIRQHRYTLLLLAILLTAMAVRMAYWERSAAFGQYELSYDDDEYFKLGALFARGEFFRDPYPLRYTRAPGYSLAMAPIIAAFGPRVELVLAFQVLVSVLTVALLYVLARRTFGRRAGLFAAGLLAIAPTYASTAGSFVLSETLFAFFVILFLYLFARWTAQGMTLWRAAVAGLVLGAGALVRPSLFYFLVPAAVWFLYVERKRWKWALPRLAVVALAMFAVILPYTARNAAVYQRFILIDTTGGWTMWRDHRTPNDDFWTKLPTIRNPGDRDRFASQRGTRNILADPVYQLGVQGAANLAAMVRLEMDSFAHGAGYLGDVMVDAPTVPLVIWDDVFFLAVVVLGIGGILLTAQELWRQHNIAAQTDPRRVKIDAHAALLLVLWLLFMILVVVVYHTQSRFRPHYAFVLIIFAGALLARGWQAWQALGRPLRAAWVGAAVLVGVLAYSSLVPPLLVSEYYIARASGGNAGAALNAVGAFSTYAKAYDALGDAYRKQGDFAPALQAYNTALKLNPYEMQARLGRMDIFRLQGEASRLVQEVRAAGVESGEVDIPAALWWSFEPAPTRRIDLGDSTSSFGYILNLYAIQPDGDEQMRFTRDRSFVKFPGVTQSKPHALAFYARAIQLPDQPLPTVTVRLNGREVAQVPLTEDWQEHVIPLDDAARAQDTLVVEFRSPTFRPSEIWEDSKDTRDLGFMLSWVELR